MADKSSLQDLIAMAELADIEVTVMHTRYSMDNPTKVMVLLGTKRDAYSKRTQVIEGTNRDVWVAAIKELMSMRQTS